MLMEHPNLAAIWVSIVTMYILIQRSDFGNLFFSAIHPKSRMSYSACFMSKITPKTKLKI